MFVSAYHSSHLDRNVLINTAWPLSQGCVPRGALPPGREAAAAGGVLGSGQDLAAPGEAFGAVLEKVCGTNCMPLKCTTNRKLSGANQHCAQLYPTRKCLTQVERASLLAQPRLLGAFYLYSR